MKISEAIKLANNFSEADKNFASLRLWEEINLKKSSTFYRFKYASQLRLCGFLSESEKQFNLIKLEDVSENGKGTFLRNLGQLYLDMGIWDRAKWALYKSIEYDDSTTIPYILIAEACFHLSETDEAIAILMKALEKIGDLDEAYYNLATRLAMKGEIESSLIILHEKWFASIMRQKQYGS